MKDDIVGTVLIVLALVTMGTFLGLVGLMIAETSEPNIFVTERGTNDICIDKVLENDGSVHVITPDGTGYYVHLSKRLEIADVFLVAHEGDICKITYVVQWPSTARFITEASCNTKQMECK